MLKEPHTLTTHMMAQRMAEPGQSVETMASQIRGFAQRDLIHNYGHRKGTGITAHRLYSESMLAQAKLLSILTDFGFADPAVMQAAALACFTIQTDNSNRESVREALAAGKELPTPMQMAIANFRRGEWPSFEVVLRRHDQTGERIITAQVVTNGVKRVSLDPPPNEPSGYQPIAVLVIDLAPMFRKLFASRASLN